MTRHGLICLCSDVSYFSCAGPILLEWGNKIWGSASAIINPPKARNLKPDKTARQANPQWYCKECKYTFIYIMSKFIRKWYYVHTSHTMSPYRCYYTTLLVEYIDSCRCSWLIQSSFLNPSSVWISQKHRLQTPYWRRKALLLLHRWLRRKYLKNNIF